MFLMRNKKNSQNYFQYPTLSAAQNPIKKCLCSVRAFSLSSLRSVLAMHLSSLYVYYTFIFVFFFSLLQVWRYSKDCRYCTCMYPRCYSARIYSSDVSWSMIFVLHKVLKEKDIMNMINVYVDGFVNWTCHNDFDFIY